MDVCWGARQDAEATSTIRYILMAAMLNSFVIPPIQNVTFLAHKSCMDNHCEAAI